MSKKAKVAFDQIAYKPFPNVQVNDPRARLTLFAARGEEVELHPDEHKRLSEMGALEGSEPEDAADPDVVLTPGKKPNTVPTDSPHGDSGAPAGEASNTEELARSGYMKMKAADVKALAEKHGIEGETKEDYARGLQAAGIHPDAV